MKKILSLFLLIITMFSVFTFSSCSNKYVELEVPVERYEIINDGGSFGTTVIQFYVTDDFEYDLDLLKDIKIKFSYRPEKSLSSKTVTEEGKVDSFIGADDSYFYVNIKNRVATNIENPVEVLSVNAKIEKRFVNDDSDIKPEKEPLFGIGMSFIIGLIVSALGIGASYIGMQVIEDETAISIIYHQKEYHKYNLPVEWMELEVVNVDLNKLYNTINIYVKEVR